MDFLPITRAVLSVTDKSGLAEFAAFLAGNGVTLVSTGGTARMLRTAGLTVREVSEVTNFPEILDGRVKTLHPAIHGGILADKDNHGHLATLAARGINAVDLVCVNLYAFAEATEKNLSLRETVEEIDIGGPCMLRAAAKNFFSVLVAPSPACYGRIRTSLTENGMKAPLALRRELAAAAFAATAAYDGRIAAYLEQSMR